MRTQERPGAPANGGKSMNSKSREPGKVYVDGKEYPVVDGVMHLKLADSAAMNLADIEEGAIIEFEDTGEMVYAQAIQKITAKGAELVVLLRTTLWYPIFLNRKVFFHVAKGLIIQRQKHQKDIEFLIQHHGQEGSLVAATIPCKGRTVGEIVNNGKRVFSDTVRGLEAIENYVLNAIEDLRKKGKIPKMGAKV